MLNFSRNFSTESPANNKEFEKYLTTAAYAITKQDQNPPPEKATYDEKDILKANVAWKCALLVHKKQIQEKFAAVLSEKSDTQRKTLFVSALNGLMSENYRMTEFIVCMRENLLFNFSDELHPIIEQLEFLLPKLAQQKPSGRDVASSYADCLSHFKSQLGELYYEVSLDEEARFKNYSHTKIYLERAICLFKEAEFKPEQGEIYEKNKEMLATALLRLIHNHLSQGYLTLACAELAKYKNKYLAIYQYIAYCAYEKFLEKEDFANAAYWLEEGLLYLGSEPHLHAHAQQGVFFTQKQIDLMIAQHRLQIKACLIAHCNEIETLLNFYYKNHFLLDVRNNMLEIDTSVPLAEFNLQHNSLLNFFSAHITSCGNRLRISTISRIPAHAISAILYSLKEFEERIAKQKSIDIKNEENASPMKTLAEIFTVKANISAKTDEHSYPSTEIGPECQTPPSMSVDQLTLEETKQEIKESDDPIPHQSIDWQKINEEFRKLKEVPAEELVQSDAQILGFSHEIFGDAKFHQCRMRNLGKRVVYVVNAMGENNEVADIITKEFNTRFEEAKIVPPKGEPGFKWLKISKDKPQILYCKNKGKAVKGWRYFPTEMEINPHGAIAFKYGTYVMTKNGVWNKKVRIHGLPSIKKTNHHAKK